LEKLHSFAKLWFELWQCVQCESAIVLKNVWWQKNKKHRVGLSVGSLVLSIFFFLFFHNGLLLIFCLLLCFLHLAVTLSILFIVFWQSQANG